MKSLETCLAMLIRCAGRDGNTLLNIGPTPTGEIAVDQANLLKHMGVWLAKHGESIYGTRGGPLDRSALELAAVDVPGSISLAARAKVTASNTFHQQAEYGPEKAVDENVETRWATDAGVQSAWLELDLGHPAAFSRESRRENDREIQSRYCPARAFEHYGIDRWPDPWGASNFQLAPTTVDVTGTEPQKWTSTVQKFKADLYRGKRIRFSAAVRSKDVEQRAGLSLSIDDDNFGDWMGDRVIQQTSDWKRYELVIDVPATAIGINIGAWIYGKGEIWVDDLEFGRVDSDVPTTSPSRVTLARLKSDFAQQPTQPVNLKFDGPSLRYATYTYKRVGPLEIKADALWEDTNSMHPVVVVIHGGALIFGGREGGQWPLRDFPKKLTDAGCAVVSIDYRLAPETKLPLIVEDVEDAFRWVRSEGPRLFQADPTRVAAWGASAGGYLALSTGHRVNPPPQAIVSVFGYGDLIGDWYSKPSTHPAHNRKTVKEEDARLLVAGSPVTNDRERKSSAGDFYNFCRQRGIWPKEVSGWDPVADADKFIPFMPVRNVSAKFPATLLIHGTADTDVPYEQSVMMGKELRAKGVEHQLITIQNAEHGFGGGDPAQVDAAFATALAFLRKHLLGEDPRVLNRP